MKASEPTPKLTKEGTALRKFALTFPDAHEDLPWGHLAVKIGKKAFVFIAAEGGVTSMSAKLPQSKKKALAHSFAAPTEYRTRQTWLGDVYISTRREAANGSVTRCDHRELSRDRAETSGEAARCRDVMRIRGRKARHFRS